MSGPIIDFPKVKSPFIRKDNEAGHYVVTPEIEPGYEWVFTEPAVRAVDKLHGTNICVHIEGGYVTAVDNRANRIIRDARLNAYPDKREAQFFAGLFGAMEKEWLKFLGDGAHYGELIGPNINSNLHRVDRYYFVPFKYLYEKCHWHSWVQNKYPKTFESISEWFKNLPSLFSQQMHKNYASMELPLAEGLVFHHPDGRMAKLRRDMFDWYTGTRHKE